MAKRFADRIEKELARSFATDEEAQVARNRLPDAAELDVNDHAVERIQSAILHLAAGDLAALSHFAECSRSDWRDVLYWREHPREADEPRSYAELRQRLSGSRCADSEVPVTDD